MKKDFYNLIKIIFLGIILSLGVGYLSAAWNNPTVGTAPPNGNISTPINSGGTPQSKGGSPVASLFDVGGTLSTQSLGIFGNASVGKCITDAYGVTACNGTVQTAGSGWVGSAGNRPVCMNASGTGGVATLCAGTSSYALTVTKAGVGSGTVTSTPLGIILCGTGGTACQVTTSGVVILNATYGTGNSFAGWSGSGATANGCTMNPSCAITLNSNQSIIATFNATTVPILTTSAIATGSTVAIGGGVVSSDAGFSVTARGVAWNTSTGPTISNSHTTDGSGWGSFSSTISGLTSNTTYYVRAYGTNSSGTGYGNELSFTTSSTSPLPVIGSTTATGIGTTVATLGATITSLGNPAVITARGVCYSKSSNPTTPCVTATLSQTVPGTYTVAVSGLVPGTVYHYRGYATNTTGTGYSADATFTTVTPPCSGGWFNNGHCWNKMPSNLFPSPPGPVSCSTYCSSLGKTCESSTQDGTADDAIFSHFGYSGCVQTFTNTNNIMQINSSGQCYTRKTNGNVPITLTSDCSQSRAYWGYICSCVDPGGSSSN